MSQTTPARIAITGSVVDSSNIGMPNVTVAEKGTKNAVSTSPEGAFTIRVAGQNSVLIFSSVGYSPKQVRVGDQTKIEVILETANNDLGEVVVIGY
ncbi:MAG TPA: carboxypeptidase-like regulatory domain-containing protein, partial [Flavitalea sp.]|nr:carboxypeptidase-like regulatory domain-containing protein [Flavitalea sp.]